MSKAMLEHVNVTVADPIKTAAMLCELFDWKVRWQGPSKLGGDTCHVGAEDNYVAVYTNTKVTGGDLNRGSYLGALNHIGVLVDDLDATEARVIAAGLKPYSHEDYDPGRRFYFDDPDGIEFEVVSYT